MNTFIIGSLFSFQGTLKASTFVGAFLFYNNYFVDKDFNACYTGIKEYLPKVDNEMKKLSFFLNLFRILPAYLIANFNRKTSELVKSDIRFWKEILNWQDKSDLYVFGILLCQKKEFRSLIRKRIHIGGGSIPSFLFRVLFKPMDTLYINTEHIGSGLYIQHGFATIIAAESIGDNCWINQQVTIGYEQNRRPVIGNHV